MAVSYGVAPNRSPQEIKSPQATSRYASGSPLSLAAHSVAQAALQEDVSVGALAKLAALDPGFAARVLATVNSAAFGRAAQVTDIAQAASLLGIRGLKNIAFGIALSDMLAENEGGRVLFGCVLRRAVAARLIAETLSLGQVDAYFTTGLFLEVAFLVQAREDMAGALVVARLPAKERPVFERAGGAETHALAGSRIVQEFGMSEEAALAVAHHHDTTPPSGDLARVCWAAERVAGLWEGGAPDVLREAAQAALAQLDITDDGPELLAKIPPLVADVAKAFSREIPAQAGLDELAQDAAQQLLDMNASYEALVRRLENLVQEKQELAQQLAVANEKLTHLAATDALTQLPNKRALQRELLRELSRAERGDEWLSLVITDVDKFKSVNDTHGHPVGDEVLKGVAEVLRKSLRGGDVAARFGGEEFVMLLPSTDPAGAVIVAERIRARLAATPMRTGDLVLKVTASFGIASVRGAGAKGASQSLLEQADQALYRAKREGRNRVVAAEDATGSSLEATGSG